MKIIEAEWESYKQNVLPADAGAVQIHETKKAFYAGVATLFRTLLTKVSADREPTASDMTMMAGIQAELDDFLNQAEIEARRSLMGRG